MRTGQAARATGPPGSQAHHVHPVPVRNDEDDDDSGAEDEGKGASKGLPPLGVFIKSLLPAEMPEIYRPSYKVGNNILLTESQQEKGKDGRLHCPYEKYCNRRATIPRTHLLCRTCTPRVRGSNEAGYKKVHELKRHWDAKHRQSSIFVLSSLGQPSHRRSFTFMLTFDS